MNASGYVFLVLWSAYGIFVIQKLMEFDKVKYSLPASAISNPLLLIASWFLSPLLYVLVIRAVFPQEYALFRGKVKGNEVEPTAKVDEETFETEVPIYDGPKTWDKHRALIFDAKLEAIPQLYGMGVTAPIHIFNPFDERAVAWDMSKDITEPATAKQIASIFIPEEKNASQPFFADASRQLLEGVMVAFILTRPGDWTFRDILVTLKSDKLLAGVLSSTPVTQHLVETYLANDRESRSVMATLASKVGSFDVVAALWEKAERKLSLKDWLESESILVLGHDEAYRSSLDILNRVIFKRLVELLLSGPSTKTGRTWFFLDEIKDAGNLDSLGALMNRGRSFGACVVLGLQDIEGFQESFGEKPAESILGLCATKVILRVDSTKTAKWSEEVFGKSETIELKDSASVGESNTEGSTDTKGTSYSKGYNKGTTRGKSGGQSSYSSSVTHSENWSDSESTATSQSTGQNLSISKSAEIATRDAVLASQFLSLPITSPAIGVNGYIAHHLGAARFQLLGFERMLAAESNREPRVKPRGSDDQYLQPWTEKESKPYLPKPKKPKEATSVSEPPAEPKTVASKPIADVMTVSRRYKPERFLPGSNPDNGIRRRN
ncbi:MAG: type IV secretion system DNA-binding domain-containing protein [Armatimonadota bacterium]